MENKNGEKIREILETDNSRNVCVIPTLFKIKKTETPKNDPFEVELESIYDPHVVRHLKKDMILNAVLPAFGAKKENIEYTYENADGKIVFKLPREKNTKMLFMRLCDLREYNESDDDTFEKEDFIAKFYKKVGSDIKGKGYVKFNMTLEKYLSLEISEKTPKKLWLYDEARGWSLIFECWTEYLPIPGESDGVFAYLDGSSEKKDQKEEKYGAGYVISDNREIRFGHKNGRASESNYAGELVAVTNVLKNIGKTKNLKLYFDYQGVGYYPGKYFDWSNKKDAWVVEYRKEYNDFFKRNEGCNIEFIHVDAHFDVFGNEMADRLAQVNDDILENKKEKKYVVGFKEDRKRICPGDGSFSDPVILKE